MGRDIHVTSRGIAHVSKRVGEELLPIFTGLSAAVHSTDVTGPGFGVMGQVQLAAAYREVQEEARRFLDGAAGVVDGWQDNLTVASQNWKLAEDKNMVRYQ